MSKHEGTRAYVGVRLDAGLIDRIEALGEGSCGMRIPRSDVIRLALDRGLGVLEAEKAKASKGKVAK